MPPRWPIPAGLALGVSNGGLDIFVASESEAGITRLRVDLGGIAPVQTAAAGGDALTGDARADLLLGGAGDDVLVGGGGDDILSGGAGDDRMTGGAGADVFVVRPGGGADEVMDFEVGVDRLDLSALGRIHDVSALGFHRRSDGIEDPLRRPVDPPAFRRRRPDRPGRPRGRGPARPLARAAGAGAAGRQAAGGDGARRPDAGDRRR